MGPLPHEPRVTPSLPNGGEGSLFQRVFSSSSGIDPYAAAVSDVYQDLFGGGSYAGKGIYDVDAFEIALSGPRRRRAAVGIGSRPAGTGYFTSGRYWPAHIEPIFSAIGQGSWVRAQGELNGGNVPAFNFNQGVAVRVSASHFYGTVRAFAVVR
jgi:hypothetical protein